MGQCNQGELVDVEDALQLAFRRCTRTQTYEPICRPYAGVVDQDVQPAIV